VKGREAAITVYEPLGLEAGPESRVRAELKLWTETLYAERVAVLDEK
jgi:hypothetical protein